MNAVYARISTCCRKLVCSTQKVFKPQTVQLHLTSLAHQHTRLEVKPFWKVRAVLDNVDLRLTSNVEEDYFIESSDSQDCPRIQYDHNNQAASIRVDEKMKGNVRLCLPYRVDLDIVLNGSGTAHIADIENVVVDIRSENYDIEFGSLKTTRLCATTECGDIRCEKTVRGNISLETAEGHITANKIQGHHVSLTSQCGHVRVGDVYAENFRVASENGIQIKSVHGNSRLQSRGSVAVGTAEGDVTVVSADSVHLHLADRANVVDVMSEMGDVEISYSPGMTLEFDIDAKNVDDCKAVLRRGTGSSEKYRNDDTGNQSLVTIKSPCGTTTVKSSSWLEAVTGFNRKVAR